MAQRRTTRRSEEDADDYEDQDDAEREDEILDENEPTEGDENKRRRRPARRRNSGLTARDAANAALRQIAELTTKPPEGIMGMERTEDGWAVGIEVVEDRRVPSSADILAIYEAIIDADGELLSYRRVRRYARGRADDGEG